MDLRFHATLADNYKSPGQRIRVLSEHWIGSNAYCVNCGHRPVVSYPNNSRIADFFCSACNENYELKSKKKSFGTKVVDGGYTAMIERLAGGKNPNFFLLAYDPRLLAVLNLVVVPKHFFIPDIIMKKRTLPPAARRAGWTGCDIVLSGIPMSGRISVVKDGIVMPETEVRETWRKMLFLREQKDTVARGWLLNVMKCIEQLHHRKFSIDEVYRFEDDLKRIFPANRHIRQKIRQQLQVLRDKGFLEFSGKGNYRLIGNSH